MTELSPMAHDHSRCFSDGEAAKWQNSRQWLMSTDTDHVPADVVRLRAPTKSRSQNDMADCRRVHRCTLQTCAHAHLRYP